MTTGTIKHRHIVEVTDLLGNVVEYDNEASFLLLTDVYTRHFNIAASANNLVIWDPTDQAAAAPSSFDYLFIRSTIELLLALIVDEDDDQGMVPMTTKLKAGHGYTLGSDFALADGAAVPPTSDIFGADGLDDVIDRLEVEERNGVAGDLLLIMGKI